MCQNHRNSRTRTLAASREITDPCRSKMVPTRWQNNRGIIDQLTQASYWLSYARYLITKFSSTTRQLMDEKWSFSWLCNIIWSYRLFEANLCYSPIIETQWPSWAYNSKARLVDGILLHKRYYR